MFVGVNHIVLMRLTDEKGPKPPIRILNNFYWGPKTKNAKIFKKILGKKKS